MLSCMFVGCHSLSFLLYDISHLLNSKLNKSRLEFLFSFFFSFYHNAYFIPKYKFALDIM
jgi:hypothetical protein